MNVKLHKISSYTWSWVITILVKFDIHFLGLPWEIFFGVTMDYLSHLWPLKNVKKNARLFKLFWYKAFVHWKLKLLNFLTDSVLIHVSYLSYVETYKHKHVNEIQVVARFLFCQKCWVVWSVLVSNRSLNVERASSRFPLKAAVLFLFSSLLPYLPMLMDPLVSALNGSQTLVSQVLKTFLLPGSGLSIRF